MNRSTTPSKFKRFPEQSEEAVPPLKVHQHVPSNQQQMNQMLCCYQNQNTAIQVVRSNSSEVPEWHLERVVFPGQRLLFHAPQKANLKVYSANNAGNLLSDTIPCDRLQVAEN